MADNILAQHLDGAPPLDTVLLWLSITIERDLVAREVFPEMRQATARSYRGSASLHFLTEGQAEAVLADALCREQHVSKSLRTAYRAHIKSVRAAVAEALERPEVFAAQSAVCTRHSDSGERWRGSKQQLLAHGIQLDGPWPNEPGGKARWARAKDARGYETSIARHSAIWPGLYEASITIPSEVWAPKRDGKSDAEKAEKARRNLDSMPKSVEDFRAMMIKSMRSSVRFELDWHSKPSKFHGFRLADDVRDRIDEALDGIVEVLIDAQVQFDPVLHSEVERRYRADFASADTVFQSKMADLLKPNPAILSGGAK